MYAIFFCEHVIVYMCDLVVLARVNDACIDQYSRSGKLHRYRSRGLLIKWFLLWQHKSLKLEMFCCDSRLRLTKIIYTVAALSIYIVCVYIYTINTNVPNAYSGVWR